MARALFAVAIASLLVSSLARAEEVIDMEQADPIASPPAPEENEPTQPSEDDDPKQMILRRLVKAKGNLVGSPNLLFGRSPYLTPAGMTTVTAEALRVYAAAGFTNTVTGGAAYSMVLNDGIDGVGFSARGPLTLFGSIELVHKGPLSVVAGGDLVLNFAGANQTTEVSVRGGATARLTLWKLIALYTGSPLAGTPQARQLSLGFYDKGRSSLSLPLGVAVQATPSVYAFAETTIFEIFFVNAPQDASGNTQRTRLVFSDITPLTFGAYYSSTGRMDLGGSFTFPDLGSPGYLVFTLGARFHTGP